MRKEILLAASLLLTCASLASAAESAMVLGFTADPKVHITHVSTAAYAPADKPFLGPGWTIKSKSGRTETWSRDFTVPRMFHTASTDALTFTLSIPRPEVDDELSITDEQGSVVWSLKVDDALLSKADASKRNSLESTAKAASLTHALPLNGMGPAAIHASSDSTEFNKRGSFFERKRNDETDARSTLTEYEAKLDDLPKGLMGNISDGDAFGSHLRGAKTIEPNDSSERVEIDSENGWNFTMVLEDAITGQRISETPTAFVRDQTGRSYVIEATPGEIRLVVPKEANYRYEAFIYSMPGYSAVVTLKFSEVLQDSSQIFKIRKVDDAKARVTVEGGSSLPAGNKYLECESPYAENVGYSARSRIADETGIAHLALPYGPTFYCSTNVNSYRLHHANSVGVSFSAQALVDFSLPKLGNVTIDLVDVHGTPLQSGISALWNRGRTSSLCSSNPCHLMLPYDEPAVLSFNFDDTRYQNIVLPPQLYPDGSRRTLQISETFNLSGNVGAVNYAKARALRAQSQELEMWATALWPDGRYSLPVKAGEYILEVEHNEEYLYWGVPFYRKPWRSSPITMNADVELPTLTLPDTFGTLQVLARLPCQPSGRIDTSGQLTIITHDGTRIQRTVDAQQSRIPGSELCEQTHTVALSPDRYDVEFSPSGWLPRSLGATEILANSTSELSELYTAETRDLVWRGTANGPTGQPAALANIRLYDASWHPRTLRTDMQGRFEFAYQPGWIAEFSRNATEQENSALRSIHRLEGVLPSIVQINDLSLIHTPDGNMLRIFGDGDRKNKFNILFLADGYTDSTESFTDINGNGTWDGVVWYDVDGNGVYNSSHDMTAQYGSARAPSEGSIPTADNEPFADTNGDGFPNIGDPGMFVENARGFLLSLFGSDFWDTHRDAFNAYLYFEPSSQAGFSVDSSGVTRVSRNTTYGTKLRTEDRVLTTNTSLAAERAFSVLPEVDVAIVLVNQTVAGGRASVGGANPDIMVMNGGPLYRETDDLTPSHEMGHVIGSLCDEYVTHPGVHPAHGSHSSNCPNASFSTERASIPWSRWLSPRTRIPTSSIDQSIGVFEGANYYAGGTYRPSYRSTMRDLWPLFNIPSRAALEDAVLLRTGAMGQEVDSSGRCARLGSRALHRREARC